MKILITGGAGFIGSHVVRYFVKKYKSYQIYNLDALTYAGNLENLIDIENYKNYQFINGDINDKEFIEYLFNNYSFDSVIHLAAESHVDRSIHDPQKFIQTNIVGTVNLLSAFNKIFRKDSHDKLFLHISTDEVFGSLGEKGFFTEESPYDPRSPYAASKASSDLIVRAYGETFGIPFIITNCSNNYGEFQFPEKLIPLFIKNIVENKKLPVYGDGNYTRDWLYVKDHAEAIDTVFHHGQVKESYNIGGFNEWKNIDLIYLMCDIMDKKLGRSNGESKKLIEFVKDRPGHDRRYAIDSTKINKKLGWRPSLTFEVGLEKTIDWYLDNKLWIDNVTSGKYKEYYNKQYNK